MHSSVNLRTDFNKHIGKRKHSLTELDPKDKRKKRNKTAVQEKMENLPKPKVNLFLQKSFAQEAVDIGKERVIDESSSVSKKISELIAAENQYSALNPFKEVTVIPHRPEDYNFEDDVKLAQEDIILKEIHDLEGKASSTRESSRRESIIGHSEGFDVLPIYKSEYEIMESIRGNLFTIICGETGTGKSTQLPRILHAYGFTRHGMIGVTQPRRLAAISLANRVAEEENTKIGERVGFQVRFESSKITPKTEIKFMTDGILLNEMISDIMLSKYSCIIVDEAHERSINTDILLGLLSRVVKLRAKAALEERKTDSPGPDGYKTYPLRVVIMSATLRTSDFTDNKLLFPDSKLNVITLESRQYKVATYLEKNTPEDYIEAAINKVVKIHTKLHAGGVLVFLTGEEEIRYFCSKLKAELESKKAVEGADGDDGLIDSDIEEEQEKEADTDLKVDQTDEIEEEKMKKFKFMPAEFKIYPLYSKLSLEEQEAIFSHEDLNSRQIVVATNIAETSLTIKNIRYVIDSGKEKQREFSNKNKIEKYVIKWTSQSSANQRKGRAGRTMNGFCYRLYSRALYEHRFKEFPDPEILVQPLDTSYLKLKAIGIKSLRSFPFISRPDDSSIDLAEKELIHLSAIDRDSLRITNLGKALSYLPVPPRFGKLLLMSRSLGFAEFGLLYTACLSSDQFYNIKGIKDKMSLSSEKKKLFEVFRETYSECIVEDSDPVTQANILGQFLQHIVENKISNLFALNKAISSFCKIKCLVYKSLKENFAMIQHLSKVLGVLDDTWNLENKFENYFARFSPQRTSDFVASMIEIQVACCITDVCRRVEYIENEKKCVGYELLNNDKIARIHPLSVTKNLDPQFALYTEAIELENEHIYITGVSIVKNPALLSKYDSITSNDANSLVDSVPRYSKAQDKIVEFKESTFGPKLWPLPMFMGDFKGSATKKSEIFIAALLEGKVISRFNLRPEHRSGVGYKEALKTLLSESSKHLVCSKNSFISCLSSSSYREIFMRLIKEPLRSKVDEKWKEIFN